MEVPLLTIETNLTNLEQNEWLAEIDDICEDHGFFEQLGTTHFAGFIEAGNNLLVTFENAETIRACYADAEPRGFTYARHDGWSHLALISSGESWFRDEAVYDFFDRMIDDGFFDDFEKIIFHGANASGYAACAYSVAAPGATVIGLCPQATLDPKTAGWDPRYKAQRVHDFSTRYGYAPEMIEAADTVFVAFDPMQQLDAMHAALFTKSHVVMLPCPLLGPHLDRAFDRLNIHDVMIKLAMDGSLERRRFMQLLRARRYDRVYIRSLVIWLINASHPRLARIICKYMMQRGYMAFFEEKLKELTGDPKSD